MDFKKEYNRNDFVLYLRTVLLPGDVKADPRPLAVIGNSKTGCITDITRLGTSASINITILEISHSSANDPRVTLSRETFRIMRQYNIKNALAVYISAASGEWRLSLVTSDLEYDEEKDQVIREFSNPRRFSFLLGPKARVATVMAKLEKAGFVSSFEELRSRFSLEVVNKEFYRQVAELFTELCGGTRLNGKAEVEYEGLLKLPTTDRKTGQEFAVRLIGRIVFCWFLKQKDLVGDIWLTSKDANETKNYYHKHIEHLFFEILNTPLEKRKAVFRTPDADHIPFLNGGLFAPHRNDFYDFDESTTISTSLNTLRIPDEWLAHLFTVLESYNFTVDENTTVDIDLSIDPEMLGRIFENLLAEINPETGETARKKTGSFYTPRAIVDYMVTESLVSYLAEKFSKTTNVETKNRLRSLFAYEKDASESEQFSEVERDIIIGAFHEMRCLDPACGSGAFPMGILQKTLLALEKLDPNGEAFIKRQLAGIENETARAITEEMLRDKGFQYIHKLTLVQDCIYGVDIQPIAVEMSRLRAFLALIVDERVDETLPNRGIRPLPNLEFKFVCANTLVHIPMNRGARSLFEENDQIQKLRTLRARYLNASGDAKHKIKDEFISTQNILATQLYGWSQNKNKGDSFVSALSLWDPFGDDECPWFDSSWMFGIGDEGQSKGKNGFDIIIGNPPYVQLQKIKDTSAMLAKEDYTTFEKTGDIYSIFYERGVELLRTGGTLCYITSNKWMRANYGKSLREFFLNKGCFTQLIDFGDSPIFENATTYTNIALWHKDMAMTIKCDAWDLSRSFTNDDNLPTMLASTSQGLPMFTRESFVIAEPGEAALKKRIEEVGTPLKEWGISINYGIKTGLNEAFIIDQAKYDELVAADPKNSEILKPVLRGRDIKRYKANWAGLYMIASHNGYKDKNGNIIPAIDLTKNYPIVLAYLMKIGDAIKNGETHVKGSGLYERSDQGKHWSNLRECAYWEDFNQPKIIFGRFMERATYTYDPLGFLHNDALYFAAPATPYLAAVLNSSTTWFYLKQTCTDLANGFLQALLQYQLMIPIPKIPEFDQKPFNIIVEMIQESRKIGLNTEGDYLEKVVDLMVYSLYFRKESEHDKLFITDEVISILGDKPITSHAIPSVTGKLMANTLIKGAVEKGLPL